MHVLLHMQHALRRALERLNAFQADDGRLRDELPSNKAAAVPVPAAGAERKEPAWSPTFKPEVFSGKQADWVHSNPTFRADLGA